MNTWNSGRILNNNRSRSPGGNSVKKPSKFSWGNLVGIHGEISEGIPRNYPEWITSGWTEGLPSGIPIGSSRRILGGIPKKNPWRKTQKEISERILGKPHGLSPAGVLIEISGRVFERILKGISEEFWKIRNLPKRNCGRYPWKNPQGNSEKKSEGISWMITSEIPGETQERIQSLTTHLLLLHGPRLQVTNYTDSF